MEIVKKEIIIIITLGVGENGHFDKSFFAGEIFQHFFFVSDSVVRKIDKVNFISSFFLWHFIERC